MSAVLDTNVLVYDTFEDSLYHGKARVLLDGLKTWILPTIVLHEYVWLMKALDVAAEVVLDKVREYAGHEKAVLIPAERRDIARALKAVVDEALSLARYNDKLILSAAVRRKAPLATFDGKLRRQALRAGVKVLP